MKNVHFKKAGVDVPFEDDEFLWARRISQDHSDPEFEKTFWAAVLEKKLANPKYSVFDDFPREEKKLPESIAAIYCPAIIERLKTGRGA